MKRVTLAAAALLGSTSLACAQAIVTTAPANAPATAPAAAPAAAPAVVLTDTGFSAGSVTVRLAYAYVDPLNNGSHVDGIGGRIDVTSGTQPELDLAYFLTDNISVQLIATATRHEVSANNTKLTSLLGPKIDLASTYVLPPAVTVQYHFFPHAALSPYVGAGVDFIWPFDTQENKYQLGGAQVVQKVGLSNMIGPDVNVGLDYNISGPWFLNVDYKQMFNHVTARVHTVLGLVKARDNLDPGVFSAGIVYRF